MSKGMTRVGPLSCNVGGCTSTGIGAISGFAALPYSYTSLREVQSCSVSVW